MARGNTLTGFLHRINGFANRNRVGHGPRDLLTLSDACAGTCKPECHAERVNRGYL